MANTKNPRSRDWLSHLEKALAAGSTLALVLSQLRKEKGVLGWLAIGLSATTLVLGLRKQYYELTAPDLWSYFTEEEEWTLAPPILGRLIIQHCEEVEIVTKIDGWEIHQGLLGDSAVAWRQNGSNLDIGPFFRPGEQERALRSLGERMWGQIEGNHAVLGEKGAIETSDESVEGEVVEFSAMRDLFDRIQSFYEAGKNRSYLLEGPPGTGKTTAVKHLLACMGVRSLRLNFETARAGSFWSDDKTSTNVEGLIQMLRPEVLIIDDFDRNYMEERKLLRLMEVAHRNCRIVLATINNKDALSQAMQRVGRFDDHVIIEKIDLEVLKSMLDPELHPYARKMAKWPIAFVNDFNVRKRVLGIAAAEEEFASLHRRATGKPLRKIKKKSSKSPAKVGKKVASKASGSGAKKPKTVTKMSAKKVLKKPVEAETT